MKHIYFILFTGIISLGFFSCSEDDLTLTPDGSEVDVNFYKTEAQLKMALYAAYDPFQNQVWTGSTYMWGNIASDDAVAGGADLSDQLDFQLVDRYILTPYTSKDQNNRQAYTNWWKMNTRCNYLIAYADVSTVFGKNAVAQAYFLKAFAYFQLTRLYGGLPIIDGIPSINDKYPRTTQAKTWEAIEGYLNNALKDDVLYKKKGVGDPSDGQATDAAAQTLLGKVYLYEKKYDKAIEILEKVAQNPTYSLEENYGNIFSPTNKHGKESIFEINFSITNAPNSGGWDEYSNSNTTYTLLGPRTGEVDIPTPATFQWGWGMGQPTQKLAAAFDAMGDTARKNNSIISSDSVAWYYTNSGSTVNFQNELTGWWDLKHVRRKGFYAASNQVGQNTVVLRLADVFLMLAEAYNQSGNDAKALEYLNKVRTRAKLAAASGSSSDLFDKIKKERQLELCLEGDRYFDLVRWGDAEKELTGEEYDNSAGKLNYATGTPGSKTNGLFPIPKEEMDNMAGVSGFEQNPGY